MTCAGATSTLVRSPLNTAVIQGSSVTLQCSSDDSSSAIQWYDSLCVTNNNVAECRDDIIYSYIVTHVPSRFRVFNVTEDVDATHVTRDLNINPTQLTDAGVYLCAERLPGTLNIVTSSAQLIVLGNYSIII